MNYIDYEEDEPFEHKKEDTLELAYRAIERNLMTKFGYFCEELYFAHKHANTMEQARQEFGELFFNACRLQNYEAIEHLLFYPMQPVALSDGVIEAFSLKEPDFEPFYMLLDFHLKNSIKMETLSMIYKDIVLELVNQHHLSALNDLLNTELLEHERYRAFFAIPMLSACSRDNLAALDMLLAGRYIEADQLESEGLSVAYGARNIEICKYLLTSHYLKNHARIEHNDYAVFFKTFVDGDIEFIQFLLAHPNTRHAFNEVNIQKAFRLAVENHTWSSVEFLIENDKLPYRPHIQYDNNRALLIACADGRHDIIESLLNAKIDKPIQILDYELSVMAIALEKHQWRTAQYLLTKTNIKNSERLNEHLVNCMKHAVIAKNLDMALWLMDENSGLKQLFDNKTDKNALFLQAINAQFFDLAYYLLNLPAKMRPNIDANNGQALQKTIDNEQWDEAINLIEKGANVEHYFFTTIRVEKHLDLITAMVNQKNKPLVLNQDTMIPYLKACITYHRESEMIEQAGKIHNLPLNIQTVIEDTLLQDSIFLHNASWVYEYLLTQYNLDFTPERRRKLDEWIENYQYSHVGVEAQKLKDILVIVDSKKALQDKLGDTHIIQRKRKI